MERHQTKDIQGCRYRRIGRCNPDDPVLYTDRSGWCRLCRYGILRLDESLDLFGRCNPDDPVLYTDRSGWCRLCRYGILRLDESLDL